MLGASARNTRAVPARLSAGTARSVVADPNMFGAYCPAMAKVRKAKRQVRQPWVRAKVLKRVFTTRVDASLVTSDMPCALCGKPRGSHHQSREGSDLHCPPLPAMRFAKPWRQSRCPYCGLKTFFNDIELKVAHEVPQCQTFSDVCASFGEQNVSFMLVDT